MPFEFVILNGLQSLHTPLLDAVLRFITGLGDAGKVWIVCALLLCLSKRYRKAGITMLLALVLEHTLCSAIKMVVQRPRPFVVNPSVSLLIGGASGYSFPSGHTASSFAAAMTLFFGKERKLFVPMFVLAVLIAFSRMYFYVHYPTDVLAGMVLGSAVAWLACRLYSRFARKEVSRA